MATEARKDKIRNITKMEEKKKEKRDTYARYPTACKQLFNERQILCPYTFPCNLLF